MTVDGEDKYVNIRDANVNQLKLESDFIVEYVIALPLRPLDQIRCYHQPQMI